MDHHRILRGLFGIFTCIILATTCGSCQITPTDPDNKTPVEPNNVETPVVNQWKRIELKNLTGDFITVFFPKEPKKFDGATLKTKGIATMHADVYILGYDDQNYVVALIDDLPKASETMSGKEKSDIFSGCWKGLVDFIKKALEESAGRELEVGSKGQSIALTSGRRWLYEDFFLGSHVGQARMTFVGKRAFLLVGLYPPDRAKVASSSFFDTAEIKELK